MTNFAIDPFRLRPRAPLRPRTGSALGALVCLFSLAVAAPALAEDKPLTITFPSEDGLEVTADLYIASKDPKAPFIVLFHQAGWSRGEYREIAPRLGAMGFNCMAVDQRSGGEVAKVVNETHRRAQKAGKGTTYLDAVQDMRAALDYARENHAKGVLIAWGSSYSAALVLRLAGQEPAIADVYVAFAPGEYFAKLGKEKTWVAQAAKHIDKPVFITSARAEHSAWKALYAAIPSKSKATYLPKTAGNHGSRALWKKFADSDGYWKSVTAFLDVHAPR